MVKTFADDMLSVLTSQLDVLPHIGRTWVEDGADRVMVRFSPDPELEPVLRTRLVALIREKVSPKVAAVRAQALRVNGTVNLFLEFTRRREG